MKKIYVIGLINLICFNVAFAVLMELKDALAYAKNMGVEQKDLPVIEKHLRQYMNKNLEIEDLQMVQVVSGFLAKKEQGKKKPEKDFDTYFNEKLAEIKKLQQQARVLQEKQQNGLEKTLQASEKTHELEQELQKKSKSKWFYTGDLLSYILQLKELQMIDTPYGKGFVVADDIKQKGPVPLFHLVSHQQIFSTCAFNALANAYALQQQVNQNKKINAKEIQKQSEKFFVNFLEKQLAFNKCIVKGKFTEPEYEVIQKLVQDNPKEFGKNFDLRIIHSTYMSSESKKIIAQEIKDRKIVHFIFHTGGHFDLASVLNQGNNQYTVFFLNSTNSALTNVEKDYLILVGQLIEQEKKPLPEKQVPEKETIEKEESQKKTKVEQEKEEVYPQVVKQQLINDALALLAHNKKDEVINNIITQTQVWKQIFGSTEKMQEFLKLLFENQTEKALKVLQGYKQK